MPGRLLHERELMGNQLPRVSRSGKHRPAVWAGNQAAHTARSQGISPASWRAARLPPPVRSRSRRSRLVHRYQPRRNKCAPCGAQLSQPTHSVVTVGPIPRLGSRNPATVSRDCAVRADRRSREERDNSVPADQGRRLILEWTAELAQATRAPSPGAPTGVLASSWRGQLSPPVGTPMPGRRWSVNIAPASCWAVPQPGDVCGAAALHPRSRCRKTCSSPKLRSVG
jgi:hypothetical protein